MKPHLSLEQQVKLLAKRGLEIDSPDEFQGFLRTHNYYRLRGYFHPFLIDESGMASTQFKDGTRVETILALVEFDRNLRNLLFEALAVLETQFRAIIAYRSSAVSESIHEDGIGLSEDFTDLGVGREISKHADWLEGYKEALERRKHTDIVQTHLEKYGGRLPIWAAVEILELGKLAALFRGFDEPISTRIASEFGTKANFLKGAVASLNDLRNHVAHQSRVWNFHYPINPPSALSKLPAELSHLHTLTDYERHKLFTRLSLLLWFDQTNSFGINLSRRLFELLSDLPESESLNYESMGFTEVFRGSKLWDGFEG